MEYLYTNWFEMVKPIDRSDYKKQSSGLDGLATHSDAESSYRDDMPSEEEKVGPSERHIHALKLYVINCSHWNNFRLN